MKWFGVFFLILLVPVAGLAQVAAVIEYFPSRITVYEDQKGSGVIKKIRTRELLTPAAQLSNESDYGLVMIEIRFKDVAIKPLLGWVKSSAVKVDTQAKIDVVSDCAKNLTKMAMTTRASRGLGDRC